MQRQGSAQRDSLDIALEGGSVEDVFHDTSVAARGSRVMLLQISDHDISLISLDNKLTIFDRRFKDIASVSQVSLCGFLLQLDELHCCCFSDAAVSFKQFSAHVFLLFLFLFLVVLLIMNKCFISK